METITLHSSWGAIICNTSGEVLEVIGDTEINGEHNYLHDIMKVDIVEFDEWLKANGFTTESEADILSVGFWLKNGEFDKPDMNWRNEIYLGIH